jgi:dTDP-4-amino-4,6-dideoxygalactose transaminase
MSAHHVVAPDARTRGALLEAMAAHDVEVRTLWDPPLHAQGVFGGMQHGNLDVTADVARRCVALPLASDLTDTEIAQVAAAAREALAG